VRLSLATLVGEAGDARLAAIAGAMLHDQDAAVGDEAERSLILLALAVVREELLRVEGCARFIEDTPAPGMRLTAARGVRGGADELSRYVADAVMTFGEHRRRGPVIAAMLLAGRERVRGAGHGARALRAWLAGTQHPSHSVVRSVLRWSKAPVARLRALEWLSRDGLGIAAGERLVRGRSLLEHELVLTNAHLLHRPLRRARLVGVKAVAARGSKGRAREVVESTFPSGAGLKVLSAAARRGLPRLCAGFGLGARARAEVLRPMLGDGDAGVRHAAARAVPIAELGEYCFDADPLVARGAFLMLSSAGCGAEAGRPTAGNIAALRRSPHAEVRRWAAEDLSREEGAGPYGRLALRRAMQAERGEFLRQLRSDLRAVNGAVALEALRRVRAMSLHQEVAAEVLGLAAGEHEEVRVIATAVALLASLGGARAREIAAAQVAHADGRVRANAVEALAKIERVQGSSLPSAVVELKGDPHHRVRANALRAAITGSLEGLGEMLGDERAMHRLAGVWLAGRVLGSGAGRFGEAWAECGARIGEMARFDEDAQVRGRAAACARMLESQLRRSWQGAGHSASGVGGAA